MKHISQDTISQIRAKLELDKKQTENEIASLVAQDPRQQEDHDTDNADSGTEAAEAEGHDRIRTLIEELTEKVQAIDDALMSIGNGTYGICVVCNTPIPEKRLLALPTATHCVSCESLA
jgi:DnaK suppressor protein